MTRFRTGGVLRSILGLSLTLCLTCSGSALDLAKDTALRLAPEDSDIFVGAMQLQEQWHRFTASKLYRNLAEVPCVGRLVEAGREQWENREGQVGQVRQMIDNPNVESLIKLVQDMVSNETFFFTDGQASQAVIAINSLGDEIRAISRSGNPQAILEYFLQLPKSEIDEIVIPTTVVGFKVQDQERVLGKLDELEGILRFGMGSVPAMQGFVEGLERVEDSRGVRIAWTIIPEMIPWEQLRRNLPPNASGEIPEKLQELLADRQICLTIGQLDGYLVFALSEDVEAITDLGKQSSLLSNPDLSPVVANASQEITSVTYVSDAYADAYFQSQLKDFFARQFGDQFQAMERLAGDSFPKGFDSIPEDLAWIDEQIEELVPNFQGQTTFSYFTETGSEVWNYARTENVVFDASKPLDVLEHVGGDPIALLAFRLQDRPEFFATARRIVRKVKSYLDMVPDMESLSDSTREAWRAGLDRGWPLLAQLADIWENQFLPSIKDGQHAWVLREGSLSSNQWYKGMPPSETPLAIPDIATITGLSDKVAMSNAWSSLFELLDSALELVRELEPDKVPTDFSIPRPKPVESELAEKYTLPIPEDCPVPQSLTPQVLLTDRFMFSSFSDQHSASLIKSQNLNIAKGVVKPGQAQSSVSYIDLGRLIQFVKPWIAYAIESGNGGMDRDLVEAQASMPALKGSDVLDLWSALEAAGQLVSVTTQGENSGSVTRTVITQP